MKRRLRRFVLIGIGVTAVDVAVLFLGVGAGLVPPAADAVSVTVAGVVSFVAHRWITFADDQFALIDHNPRSFVLAVGPAAAADVAVVWAMWFLGAEAGWALLVAKAGSVSIAALIRLVRYRTVLFAAVRADQENPSRPRTGGSGPRLSVVIPVYRDPERIGANIERLRAELAELGAVEVIVVDDGSGDRTPEVAREAGADNVLVQPVNRGKGAAVRRGMLAATGRTVAFTDADLAYPPAQLISFVHLVEAGWDVAVGNRRHPDAVAIERAGLIREAGSLVFNLLTHIVLLGQYRDTQCGLKAFDREAARLVFSNARVDGFAFDVEVLHLVERYRLSLAEVPVTLDEDEHSTISLIPSAVRMFRDVLGIRRRSALGDYDLDLP